MNSYTLYIQTFRTFLYVSYTLRECFMQQQF